MFEKILNEIISVFRKAYPEYTVGRLDPFDALQKKKFPYCSVGVVDAQSGDSDANGCLDVEISVAVTFIDHMGNNENARVSVAKHASECFRLLHKNNFGFDNLSAAQGTSISKDNVYFTLPELEAWGVFWNHSLSVDTDMSDYLNRAEEQPKGVIEVNRV